VAAHDLTGKKALVTGAARGLGRAYALRLARAGADVAVFDIKEDAYEDFELEAKSAGGTITADAIRAEGRKSLSLVGDIGSIDDVRLAISTIDEEWGGLDIIVCNAGGGVGAFEESRASILNLEDTATVFQRNLWGTIHTCVTAVPLMKRNNYGRIITVASSAGVRPMEGGLYAHYGTSKAAIIMYTRALAQDVGPSGITANTIAPGQIGTGRLMPKFEEQGVDKLTKNIPLRRLGTVDDCASVVEFLASDESAYVTGVVIPIDGGLTRCPS
jgi:3-oxoacyl-[acyl-carrier protein] reductase